jgi:pyridinium-3,5-bisthiocarboxylic acid mononucleotide nickel chelatase
VLRLLVGEVVPTGSTNREPGALVLETNVDDLDPRLWPPVLSALLESGASDAWLSPILMKKGRPAHTLHVLVRADQVDAVRREVFRHTSTIGVREVAVGKTALERAMRAVTVDGERIAVKLALLDGEVVNAQPEYEDVARVATVTGRPVKAVLAAAIARVQEEAWT